MLTVLAPAKINFTLEVLGKRPDDYHEIRSVIQTISLGDRLSFEPGKALRYKSSSTDWSAEKSLVARAARLLREATGYDKGATITVEKHIPMMAGLGGDSSDAAATLRALNWLWGLDLSMGKLAELARQLGSDVTFFLYGGTALLEGRGELVTPLPPMPHMWIVVAMPTVNRLPGKTKLLYGSLNANHYTDGQITKALVQTIKDGREITPSLLFNTFENVAYARFPQIHVSQRHMTKMGAPGVHLTGSGPALFTLIKDRVEAEDLHFRLQGQSLQPYLAETLPAVDHIA